MPKASARAWRNQRPADCNWRSLHSLPLDALQVTLRKRSAPICEAPIVPRRLKRVPSIIHKLRARVCSSRTFVEENQTME